MGFSKLNQTTEAGEKLYSNTASDGRDVIRQELRALKQNWDVLFDDVTEAYRKQEVALVEWTSFDDSHQQVEQWLREMELRLNSPLPHMSTLEEKRSQAQQYKVCFDI